MMSVSQAGAQHCLNHEPHGLSEVDAHAHQVFRYEMMKFASVGYT